MASSQQPACRVCPTAVSALHAAVTGACTATGFRGTRRSGKIDHVLVAAGAATIDAAEILRTREGARHPSDHCPVAAVIRWP